MNKQEKEDAQKRIVNFYNDAAGGNLKKTVNFFLKQGMKRSTIYYTIQKYKRHKTTKDLPHSGRPAKLSNDKVAELA
jgi:transposase